MAISTIIITAGSVVTSLLAVVTLLFKAHSWFENQNKQDKEIRMIKDEQRVICTGVLACLDGLEQLGCNHSVPKAKENLEKHINRVAHR